MRFLKNIDSSLTETIGDQFYKKLNWFRSNIFWRVSTINFYYIYIDAFRWSRSSSRKFLFSKPSSFALIAYRVS